MAAGLGGGPRLLYFDTHSRRISRSNINCLIYGDHIRVGIPTAGNVFGLQGLSGCPARHGLEDWVLYSHCHYHDSHSRAGRTLSRILPKLSDGAPKIHALLQYSYPSESLPCAKDFKLPGQGHPQRTVPSQWGRNSIEWPYSPALTRPHFNC